MENELIKMVTDLDSRIKNMEMMLSMMLKQQSNPETKDEIDIEEAAKIAKLTVGTLYQYASKGKLNIPITKVGNKLFFKKQDILRWNVDRTVTTLR